MASSYAFSYGEAGVRSAIGIVSANCAGALHRGFMEKPLALLFVARRNPEAYQPFLGYFLEEICHAFLLGARSLLQIALQAGRQTPAIHFGLRHA
jgi:hypothetical protein